MTITFAEAVAADHPSLMLRVLETLIGPVPPHQHRWVTAVLIAKAADFRPLGVVERDFAVMGDSEPDGNLYDLSKVFCADCGEHPV